MQQRQRQRQQQELSAPSRRRVCVVLSHSGLAWSARAFVHCTTDFPIPGRMAVAASALA